MTTYTVIPKNPACGSPVVEADGYDWRVEKVVFWEEGGGSLEPRPVVAEFTVDWVAGVETAKGD